MVTITESNRTTPEVIWMMAGYVTAGALIWWAIGNLRCFHEARANRLIASEKDEARKPLALSVAREFHRSPIGLLMHLLVVAAYGFPGLAISILRDAGWTILQPTVVLWILAAGAAMLILVLMNRLRQGLYFRRIVENSSPHS